MSGTRTLRDDEAEDYVRRTPEAGGAPVGTVVLDGEGNAWQRRTFGDDVAGWFRAGAGLGIPSTNGLLLASFSSGIRVVHVPDDYVLVDERDDR